MSGSLEVKKKCIRMKMKDQAASLQWSKIEDPTAPGPRAIMPIKCRTSRCLVHEAA
jgi:hypothetical protein